MSTLNINTCEYVGYIHTVQNMPQWTAHGNELSGFIKSEEFLDQIKEYHIFNK
jgi:hypothetical protein